VQAGPDPDLASGPRQDGAGHRRELAHDLEAAVGAPALERGVLEADEHPTVRGLQGCDAAFAERADHPVLPPEQAVGAPDEHAAVRERECAIGVGRDALHDLDDAEPGVPPEHPHVVLVRGGPHAAVPRERKVDDGMLPRAERIDGGVTGGRDLHEGVVARYGPGAVAPILEQRAHVQVGPALVRGREPTLDQSRHPVCRGDPQRTLGINGQGADPVAGEARVEEVCVADEGEPVEPVQACFRAQPEVPVRCPRQGLDRVLEQTVVGVPDPHDRRGPKGRGGGD